MTVARVVIAGAGGLGRETLGVLRDMDPEEERWKFAGFVTNDPPDAGVLGRLDAAWVGTDDDLRVSKAASHYVIGIGAPGIRREVASRLDAIGLIPLTLIHPTAVVGMDVEIGSGSVLCAHTSVTTNVRIGRHVCIDRMTTVGHDCVIEDFVTLHPATVISGNVRISEGARLGANSCVLPGISLGQEAVVGAGAVVTANVQPGVTVVGVPARPLSKGIH